MIKTMKEEKELQERIERTVNIFTEQVKRALGSNCGIFVVIGNGNVCTGALCGNMYNTMVTMSMLICKEENVRKFVKETLDAAEYAIKKSANEGKI